jgi:hypothetical protein
MANFTSQVNEKVALNGTTKEALNVQTISGADYIDNRVTTIGPGNRTTIFSFNYASGTETFSPQTFKYARITNKSTSVPVKITINTSANTVSYLIAAGGSFMLSTTKMGTNPDSFSFEEITTVQLEPSGSSGGASIEYFIVGS